MEGLLIQSVPASFWLYPCHLMRQVSLHFCASGNEFGKCCSLPPANFTHQVFKNHNEKCPRSFIQFYIQFNIYISMRHVFYVKANRIMRHFHLKSGKSVKCHVERPRCRKLSPLHPRDLVAVRCSGQKDVHVMLLPSMKHHY